MSNYFELLLDVINYSHSPRGLESRPGSSQRLTLSRERIEREARVFAREGGAVSGASKTRVSSMRGQLLAPVSVGLPSHHAGGFRASGDIVKPTAKTTTKTV